MHQKSVFLLIFNTKLFVIAMLTNQSLSRSDGYVRNNEIGLEFMPNAYVFAQSHDCMCQGLINLCCVSNPYRVSISFLWCSLNHKQIYIRSETPHTRLPNGIN